MRANMSGLMTNGKYWTTDCIRHPKRRLCVCCPNGLHIDVDFDMFYKTLTKMQQQQPEEMATKQYKHFRRKQDPTIDALLGYRNKSQSTINIDEIVYKSRDMPAKASPDVQESLEQALHDFEETLIRSSTSDVRSPLVSPLLTNQFSSSLSLRSDTKSESLYKYINGDKNDTMDAIRTPPEMFRTSAESVRTESRTSSESTRISTTDQMRSPDLTESPRKNVKDVGINCTVLTRDIGTMYTTTLNRSVATNTSQVITSDSSTMTEDKSDSTTFNLNQILESTTQKVATVGTQTYSKITSLLIVEKRDQTVQTDTESSGECKLRNLFDERLLKRTTAMLTDSSRHELQPIIENRRLYSKYSQTKDVVVKDRVLCKRVGSQTDLITPKCRDTAVNTVRKRLVNAATGDSSMVLAQDWCEKCRNSKANNVPSGVTQSVSKIPRPKSAQSSTHSNKKKLLMRQDTYVTIPSPELEKLKELQQREPESSNQTQSVFENLDLTELRSDESYFQPISENKVKTEPSKEMKAAMKVLNDSLRKPTFAKLKETSLRSAIGVIQQEWFKISSLSSADPLIVEDYLDAFEEVSTHLLEFIVNLRDANGNTAMHYAVSHCNFDVVSVLLDSKVCNIDVVNDAGYTCIMILSLAQIKSNTHCDVIKRLFAMADVNMKAKQHGQTTLMLAASHGKLDIVKLLLESGADVNIQDDDGSTALMCAAEHGYLDIVNVLATHPDIDLTIKDNDNSTALTIAMEAGHREIGIALYTRQHFADLNQAVSAKEKRSRSANPILMEHRTRGSSSLKSAPSSPSAIA